jgi:hypothetical protein
MRRLIIFLVVFFCGGVLLVISDRYNNNHKFTFLTFPKNHSIMINLNEPAELSFSIYAKEKRSMYMDPECMSSVRLIDRPTEEVYALEGIRIKKHESLYEYEEEEYQGYDIFVSFPFRPEQKLYLENAYLSITYQNGENLMLKVGTFAFCNYVINSGVRISYLKGLIGSLSGMPTLGAVITKVTNDTDEAISLQKIHFVSSFIEVNYDYICEMTEESVSDNLKLEELIGSYELQKKSVADQFDFTIGPSTSLYLLIPVTYRKEVFINQVGFELVYEGLDDQSGTITSPSFRYFSTRHDVTAPDKLIYVRN